MATPNSLPDTPDALTSPTRLSAMFGGVMKMSDGINKMLHDILSIWTKAGVGANNQTPAVGRQLLGKLDGTTEWLVPHLYNSLRNGGAERWSLGTNIAVPASTSTLAGMGPDCWVLKTGANQASHVAQVAGLTDGSQWAAKVSRDSGQTGTGVMVYEHAYTLEEIVKLRNQKYSLSKAIKAGANFSPSSGNITIRVACGTGSAARRAGSAYTSETTLISQTVALSTTAAALQYISSVVVPTNATQMSVCFEWTPVGTAGADDSFTVDDIMGVPGDVPMPFKTRVDDAFECLRHVEVLSYPSFQAVCAGQAYDTTHMHGQLFFAPKRTTPAVTLSAAADFSATNAGFAGIGASTIAASQIGVNSAWLDVAVASGLVAGNASSIVGAGAGTGNGKITVQAGV